MCVHYEHRMNPDELQSFMQRFDSQAGSSNGHYIKTAHSFLTGSTTGNTGTQCSIRGIYDEE